MPKKKPRAQTKKPLNKGQKVRAMKAKHPNATPKELAAWADVDIQTVYRVNMVDRKKNGQTLPKKTAQKVLANEAITIYTEDLRTVARLVRHLGRKKIHDLLNALEDLNE